MTENMLQHHHFHWNKPNMSYIICAFHRGDLESHILLSYSTSLNFPPKKKQKQNHLLPVFWWGRKPVKLYWFLLISGDTPAPQVLPTFQAWRSTVNHCSPWRSDAAGMTTMVTCCHVSLMMNIEKHLIDEYTTCMFYQLFMRGCKWFHISPEIVKSSYVDSLEKTSGLWVWSGDVRLFIHLETRYW